MLSQVIGVGQIKFKLGLFNPNPVQPFDCLTVIVNGGDILLDILYGIISIAAISTAIPVTFETLEWRIFEGLQYSNLSVNLGDSVLICGNIKFYLADEIFKARLLSSIGILCTLEATARQI